jgi:PAS domain S-box-containing protein
MLGILLACSSRAFALNPALDVSQYAHTAWKVSDGLFKGIIFAIAQTPDGYLWIGTDSGLRRFDGVRSIPWQPPAGTHLPSNDIRVLRGARDGRLWIGTTAGLASWKEGRLTNYPALDGNSVEALFEDREGTIWAGGVSFSVGRLCAIRNGQTDCFGQDGRFGSGVTAIYEDRGGNLWAGATTGLWRWKTGETKVYPIPDPDNRINALIESDDGGILVAKDSGITKLRDGKTEAFPLPEGLEFQPGSLLRDRDGALWIGAIVDSGLLHIHNGKIDLFTRSDGLSGNTISTLLEDREGNIWVAGVDGIDRFRDFAVSTLSIEQALSSRAVLSVLGAKDGNVWLATDNGLHKWKNGDITVYRRRRVPAGRGRASIGSNAEGLPDSPRRREIIDDSLPADSLDSIFEDSRGQIWVTTHSGVAVLRSDHFFPVSSVPHGIVFSIAEDRTGAIWLSHQEGLLRLSATRVVERIPWAKLGRGQPATVLLHDDAQDGLWLGFRGGGVAYLKKGQITATYETGEGLASLYVDAKGMLWGATDQGLSRIKDGLTLSSKNGLPCNTVHWMIEDRNGSVWLYMACALVRIARPDLDAWASDPKAMIHPTVFDSSDGVRTQQFHYGYSPIVTKAADGKIWFVPFGGVSVIDPDHLPTNTLAPPIHIEQITADDKPYNVENGLRLPPGIRDLLFDFTALTFLEPEHVAFRVKLEGQDEGWRELVNQRQVHYTNLSPKQYRFRVLASNDSGVWNEEGASLDFSILPAWYQKNWFRALAAAAFLALLWVIYRMRVRQLEQRERKFREAVETMPALAFVARPDGHRTFVNRGWTDFTGMTLEQSFGFGWQAAVHPDDRKRVLNRWQTAFATSEPFDYELRLRRGADGQYRWFLVRVVPVRDARGKLVKWCGLAADIEDRRRAEQLQAELAHINRVSNMGEITASIAHEINQPLSGIVSNGSACLRWLAADAPDMGEVREAVHDMVRDGKRAGEIINTLRAMYKKTPPKKELVDVNEIIREMVVLLRSEAHRHAVSIRTDLAADIPKITADRVQLQQVLMNLMLNGIEAMGQTGGVLTVKLQPDQTQVLISVIDTGVGLPAEDKERIFDAFFTTKAQGSGMGLAISRSIIESHYGRLWATANEGRGASFHFSLPMAIDGAAAPATK